jgi:hypothetical protein
MPDEGSEHDAKLEQALKDFRSSVHAWSEAEYSHPHQPVRVVRLTSWRVATGWALGCVLAAGSLTGGLYEHHHRKEVARIAAAAEAARQQKLAAEQRAREEDQDLMAKVDSDISRQVPSAMEPLAQLMADDEAQ